jgi:hypothetical protein
MQPQFAWRLFRYLFTSNGYAYRRLDPSRGLAGQFIYVGEEDGTCYLSELRMDDTEIRHNYVRAPEYDVPTIDPKEHLANHVCGGFL